MNPGVPQIAPCTGDDIETLRAALVAERASRRDAEALVAQRKLLIARMRHDKFAPSSERGRKLLDQLELQLAELEETASEDEIAAERPDAPAPPPRRTPVRGPLPAHLPRERVVIPGPTTCPCCGGALSKLGETIPETLEMVPRRWKVVQTVREKFSCRACEAISQPRHRSIQSLSAANPGCSPDRIVGASAPPRCIR